MLQPRQLLVGHHARIEVRQQPRLLDHLDRGRANVVEGRDVPTLAQTQSARFVPLRRRVPEGEQCLLASGSRTSRGDRDDLFGREEGCIELGRWFGEGAVMTMVAAEHRQRNEDLPRIGDRVAPSELAEPRGDRTEFGELVALDLEERRHLFERQGLACIGASERPVSRRGGAGGGERIGHRARAYYPCSDMKVAALAGGIGAGEVLRGLTRVVPGEDLTVIVNVADDIVVHGLHVSPDPDSVTYWLGDAFDRARGGGRRDETFRANDALSAFCADRSWFGLGDLDLGTHLFRTGLLGEGASLSEITARIAARFGVGARLLPASDDRVETRIVCTGSDGGPLDLHFQEYWVRRGGRDEVTGVRYEGADAATPAPGVLEAIAAADVVVVCPSNPVVSIGPILAVPGVRDAVV